MKLRHLFFCLLLAPVCFAQTVGEGAPTEAIRTRWLNAYYRNGFAGLTALPTTLVVKFGTTGLSQEFSDASNTGGTRFALVKANQNSSVPDGTIDVFQVYPLIYGTYKAQVATYGYPTVDSTPCFYAGDFSCLYQTFDKNYALFSYARATLNGQTFVMRDPYYTKWVAAGGINRMGPATNAELSVTSKVSAAVATMQSFNTGAVYNITSGTLNGRILAVRSPIFSVYSQNGGHSGFLGYPAGEEIALPNGLQRQSFEGGAIDYDPVSGGAFLRPGVSSVVLSSGGPLKLLVGESAAVQASVFAGTGDVLTDRTINWTTTNARVVTIQAQAGTATLKAVGPGSANVTAIADGKASLPLQVIVTGVCCQVGEGAPSLTAQQAFADAVVRNNLTSLQLPTANPVRRLGSGYVQEFTSVSGSQRYLLGLADQTAVAWMVTGAILERYTALGGPAGPLGYPASDPTTSGRQLFQAAALAGNPLRLVSGAILARWSASSYEAGPAGAPAGDESKFLTFGATAGVMQPFTNGVFYSLQTGSQSGHTYFVSGSILARYNAMGGPAGSLGAPWTDEFTRDGQRRQEFEGGTAQYWPSQTDVEILLRERKPAIDATPAVASAGSRIRISISGFADGASLRVSVTGQPDFVVATNTGSYSWDVFIPSSAASGTVTLRAASLDGGTSVQGSYVVRSVAEARPKLTILSGDNQVGVPGSVLPRALRVAVRDDDGNALLGIPVVFEASPGAQIISATPASDGNGEASAVLRLSESVGITLATARVAGSSPVTFSARISDSTLLNFPRLMQSGDTVIGAGGGTISNQGAMLAATASILRYYQGRGELPTAALVDPVSLNQSLTNLCVPAAGGEQLCDGYLIPAANSTERIVNLWRLGALFANSVDVAVDKPELAAIRDALSQGRPALLSLSVNAGDAPLGSHYVVAIGVAADGNIQIHDPSPLFNRTSLSEYLDGFTSSAGTFKATLSAVVRLLPMAPASAGFLVVSSKAPVAVQSSAGNCGNPMETPAVAAVPATMPATAPDTFRALYCDGLQPLYQLDSTARDSYRLTLTDLGSPANRMELSGGGEAAFRVAKLGGAWQASAQEVGFSSASIVNAATFEPGVAPGGLMAIFGTGLARAGSTSKVTVAGKSATVVSAGPFQLNVQVPLDTPAGTQSVSLASPYGTLAQPVEVRSVAPAIFTIGADGGAVVNQDGLLNTTLNPLRRGQTMVVYCTGLGAVAAQGALQVVRTPVVAVLQGRELKPAFAGLTPQFVGLYQVNVPVPSDLPPGLGVALSLRQAEAESNTVLVSVQ